VGGGAGVTVPWRKSSAETLLETDVGGASDAATDSGEPVSGLPFSHGKSFRTLDEYLAHLQKHAAPIDQPWWREIRPGVYEHVKRMPGAPREIATRAELMKRFGFSS
jgi:hypothetical protein